MSMSQRRPIPRWKGWKLLATQQLRLRSLVQVIGFNLGTEDLEGKSCGHHGQHSNATTDSYYYTLHLTAMSAPFYTSEKNCSNCPKWKEIDNSCWSDTNVFGGTQAMVLRIWCQRALSEVDEVLTVWAVNLTGLVHLSVNLSGITMPSMPNTLVFLLPGGYYTCPQSMKTSCPSRLTSVIASQADVLPSYSLKMINKISAVQQSTVQRVAETKTIQVKISSGDFLTPENRGNAMWRRFRNKSNHLDINRIKEMVEEAKFRLGLLQAEKERMALQLAASRSRLETLSDENVRKESRTMEEYRILRRGVQALRDKMTLHFQHREYHLHLKAHLNIRVNQLISELQAIYPIHQKDDKFYICGVHLPDSENLTGSDDLKTSVALGFVAHVVQMVSVFLQVPLRYPVVHFGSRSRVLDFIADKFPDSEREFPLFCKGKDKMQFHYAVYLLNKNIAGLLWLCGLDTKDLRCTLANLLALLRTTGVDMPVDNIRSPSSSTLDLASSVFSIPSPLHTMTFQRPSHHRSRVSESAIDSVAGGSLSISPAKTAVSVLKAQEFESRMNTNLSFSLDKGLNQLRDCHQTTEWTAPDAAVGVSGRHLKSGPCNKSSNETFCSAEDAASSQYGDSWPQEQTEAKLVEDDERTRERPNVSAIVERRREDARRRGEGERVSVGLEVSDLHLEGFEGTEIEESVVEVEGVCTDEMPADLDEGRDALLDNVANRTEALANRTSSFNMFRSRFRSTLGGTN